MNMDNNLDEMIGRTGLSKKAVAQEKGITPETLSRHIHGKIQLTLSDAEDYSQILSCTPQEIMFRSLPIPIIGYVNYDRLGLDSYDLISEREKNCGTTEEEKEKINEYNAQYPSGSVYSPTQTKFDLGAIIFNMHPEYLGPWAGYDRTIALIDLRPIKNNYVCKNTYQAASYVKIKDGTLAYGHVYPEPGNTFTVHNPWRQDMLAEEIEFKRGLKLDWATPIIQTIWNPRLSGTVIKLDKK